MNKFSTNLFQSHIKISIFTEETSEAVLGWWWRAKIYKKTFCGLNLLFCWFEVEKKFSQLPQEKNLCWLKKKKMQWTRKIKEKA